MGSENISGIGVAQSV